MVNAIIRYIQSLLMGIILAMEGYSYKSLVFWMYILIMTLQWFKEQWSDSELFEELELNERKNNKKF